MKVLLLAPLCTLQLGLVCAANAGTINFGSSGNSFQYVADNTPALGNVWIGLAQSFIAQDPHVSFGFYMQDFPVTGSQVTYSLYTGNGTFTTLLDQQTVTLGSGSGPFADQLPLADFSPITLTPGSYYTVAVTLPSMTLPAVGSSTDAGVEIANNLYAAGQSYFVGWQGSTNIPSPNGTYAFEVLPVSLPEPTTISMFLVSLLGVGGVGLHGRLRGFSRRGG